MVKDYTTVLLYPTLDCTAYRPASHPAERRIARWAVVLDPVLGPAIKVRGPASPDTTSLDAVVAGAVGVDTDRAIASAVEYANEIGTGSGQRTLLGYMSIIRQ
jgi:hypothetical protein